MVNRLSSVELKTINIIMKFREILEDGDAAGTVSADIATVAYPLFVRGRNRKEKRANARRAVGQKPDNLSGVIGRGVFESSLNEFAPVGRSHWGNDDDADPYRFPKPKSYRRSIDFFGQFEADHFDHEDFDDASGEFKGYWGKTQIAYFKFDNPAHTGNDDPGMGWYYEPESTGSAGTNATPAPAADTSAQRKQQELGMIDAFLKSGQTPKPGTQIYSLMKRHGMAESAVRQKYVTGTSNNVTGVFESYKDNVTVYHKKDGSWFAWVKLNPASKKDDAIKSTGATKDEALDNLYNIVDPMINKRKNSNATITTVGFNGALVSGLLRMPGKKFFAKFEDETLLISEVPAAGFRPVSDKQPSPTGTFSRSEIANAGLDVSARYDVSPMATNDSTVKSFQLTKHSDIVDGNDRLLRPTPSITIQLTGRGFSEAHVLNHDNVIYRLDRENPMSDTEVAVLGGAGRYSLKALRDKARREADQLAQDLKIEHGGAFRRSAENIKQLTNTLNTIVAAYNELKRIRSKGGRGSRGITDEDANFIRECMGLVQRALKENVAVEPDASGYEKTKLTSPQFAVVVDTPSDYDWYKIGNHWHDRVIDPHEFGQEDSDTIMVGYGERDFKNMLAKLDQMGFTYKLIGGTHSQPEIHKGRKE